MNTFISYSHKDTEYIEKLHKHLVMLKREGKIEAWFDQEIMAGGEIDAEISKKLDQCQLFLAMVSPDFIASEYCYEQEMRRAIKRHEQGLTRVIPIILEPCDWQSTPLKKFKALPQDGKPISEWTNPNTAYLGIVNEIRKVTIDNVQNTASPAPENTIPAVDNIIQRYRTKRAFDEIDKADFRKKSYQIIADYIQKAIIEIDALDDIKARFNVIGPHSFSCTILNKGHSQSSGSLTVHGNNPNYGGGDITYSFSDNAPINTSNGGFHIESDDYELFLKEGFSSMYGNRENHISAIQVAEKLWLEVLEKAGISYA